MSRKTAVTCVLVCLLTAGWADAQTRAGECAVGPGLGATLLVPYFEVDLTNPSGVTTLVSINNGLADPALTRVVLWTDWGVPTLAFDVYLEGFDVQTLNLRFILSGELPATGAGADLDNFFFCDVFPPFEENSTLSMSEVAQLMADHTGQTGPLHVDCAGEAFGDGIARGYLTADVVSECSGLEVVDPEFTPANTEYPYFDAGEGGLALNDNLLWGDIFYVDFEGNAAQGMDAVAVWADASVFDGDNIFTFYGRYSGWDGRDDRVPLPNLWNQRFLNGGPFAGGASIIAWRGTGSPSTSPAPCGSHPAWWPLSDEIISLTEQADNAVALGGGSGLPLAAQRVDVGTFNIPYSFGWIQVDTGLHQSWIQPTLTAGGVFSAGLNGVPVDFLCDETPPP